MSSVGGEKKGNQVSTNWAFTDDVLQVSSTELTADTIPKMRQKKIKVIHSRLPDVDLISLGTGLKCKMHDRERLGFATIEWSISTSHRLKENNDGTFGVVAMSTIQNLEKIDHKLRHFENAILTGDNKHLCSIDTIELPLHNKNLRIEIKQENRPDYALPTAQLNVIYQSESGSCAEKKYTVDLNDPVFLSSSNPFFERISVAGPDGYPILGKRALDTPKKHVMEDGSVIFYDPVTGYMELVLQGNVYIQLTTTRPHANPNRFPSSSGFLEGLSKSGAYLLFPTVVKKVAGI